MSEVPLYMAAVLVLKKVSVGIQKGVYLRVRVNDAAETLRQRLARKVDLRLLGIGNSKTPMARGRFTKSSREDSDQYAVNKVLCLSRPGLWKRCSMYLCIYLHLSISRFVLTCEGIYIYVYIYTCLFTCIYIYITCTHMFILAFSNGECRGRDLGREARSAPHQRGPRSTPNSESYTLHPEP